MRTIFEFPISIQTLFADLVERAWTGNLADLAITGGAAYSREEKGRLYWYWQPGTERGKRPPARYLGPDNDQTREQIRALSDHAANLKDRRDMVRALRAARLPNPDRLSGQVLAAMAQAGVFRLRAVVVGAVAFQSYSGILGVRIPASVSWTSDLDIGQFHSIAVAVEDRIDVDLEELLTAVDPRFAPVPDPIDGRRAVGYALRRGKDEVFSVDVLRPLRGPDRSGIVSLPAPRSDAQHQRYLDFLLHQVVNSVALFGAGVPINVPDPTRFALHKLIVAQIRQDDARGAAKARNDIQQAGALIEVLSRQRPDDLKDVWEELNSHGASWREMASRSFDQLPPNVRSALGDGR